MLMVEDIINTATEEEKRRFLDLLRPHGVSTLTTRYPFCHCGADMRGKV